jgi:RNA polymerase sigma-70 factor (ECF subfamily)
MKEDSVAAAGPGLAPCSASKTHRSFFAQRVTRNREDAADAVQDALMNAFLHAADFDGRSSFSTWLTLITINSALMILRNRRGAHGIASVSTDDFGTNRAALEVMDGAPSPEHTFARTEEKRILDHANERLRKNLRQVVKTQH